MRVIRIYVKFPGREALCFDVDLYSTIRDLKLDIGFLIYKPYEYQILRLNGKILENNSVLAECNIYSDCIIVGEIQGSCYDTEFFDLNMYEDGSDLDYGYPSDYLNRF